MQSLVKHGPQFQSSPSYYPQTGCLHNCDVIGYFTVIVTAIYIFTVIGVAASSQQVVAASHMHYTTMASFGLLFGLVSLVTPTLTKSLPEMEIVCYIFMAMAFFVEGIIFKFHLFGRDDLDDIGHTLLYNVVFLTVLIIVLEINYKNSVLLTLSRAYLTLLHGTWFWQLAFILYNPVQGVTPWYSDKHENLMLVVCMFTWHMGAVLLGMMITGLIIALIYSRSRSYPGITWLPMQAISENGYFSLLDQNNDAESAG